MNKVPTPMQRELGRQWELILAEQSYLTESNDYWLMFGIVSGRQTIREAVSVDIHNHGFNIG